MEKYPFPKKKYGQNFLTNQHIATKIIDSLNINENDSVIEIGPGTGILTNILLKRCTKQAVVEIDPQLCYFLKNTYNNQMLIFNQDILSFDWFEYFQKVQTKTKVVGNIPYNITSPILFNLMENCQFITEAVLMIQKEVALRLTAKTNCKEYGILSVLLGVQSDIEKLFNVARNNFYPQPNIDSTVVRITFLKTKAEIENYDLFKKIVKSTFNYRRKMIKNTLKTILSRDKLNKIKTISLELRPENLSVIDFMNLAQEISSLKNN